MPSVDKKTGKPVGGAAKARARKAKLKAAQKRKPTKTSLSFADLPDPPLDDTAALITWGAKSLAVAMRRSMQDPSLFDAERDQLKFIAECVAKLGLIRDKATEQEKLQRAAAAAGKVSGTRPVGAQSLAAVPKPSTAR